MSACQKRHDEHAGSRLRNDGGYRRAPDVHAQREDEHGVERDVERRADDDRYHGDDGKPLRGNKDVESQRHQHEDRAERIDRHIFRAVSDGLFACAERHQKRFVPHREHHRQRGGRRNEQRKTVSQNFLGGVVVPRAHKNGSARRAARTDEIGKRRYQQDDGKAHAHAGKRRRADFGNMSDIDPVHEVIKQIDELRRNGGHGKFKKKPARFFRA